ncbi:hydrolase [Cnuibacter physcomitrellae]|uniref:Hydrolase n=1 Tax=Cnuibacter physcomitrellae TaxID=1619308 RepID=A0A1X9LQE6_9MICO|nr:hydrolase [Cnuibacter physcomitrellae]
MRRYREDVRDRPWRRSGAARYALGRARNAVRPPVHVVEAPRDLRKLRDVEVRMRDGVILRVNVYLPPGEGPFPVLMSAHPYGKDNVPRRTRRGWRFGAQTRITNQSLPYTISSETGWEAPDPVTWTRAGYAVVNADLRGAGTSDGVGTLLDDAEARDVYDLVEWAGAQPWSTGAVGMLGVSYLALSQYKVAGLQPPSLKAICPWEGFTDAYRDFMRQGGLEEDGFATVWTTMTKRGARLSVDIGRERHRHPLRDAWWEAMTPDLGAITVPMLVCGSFSDGELHSTGSFRAFERVSSEHRHLYTHRAPKWWAFYSDAAIAAQRAFFDRHLKGADARPLPPVRLEVRERGDRVAEVRAEHEWPLARTQWRPLHLGPGGTLVEGRPARGTGSASITARGAGLAFDLPLADDLELTGPMSAQLWVSVEGAPHAAPETAADAAADAAVFVTVEKRTGGRWVPFEGSYGYGRDRVALGMQRVAARELDAAASQPGRPVHTFARLQPIAPGEIVPVDVALTASSTLFRRGDVLRLIVTAREPYPRNPFSGHLPAHHASPRRGRVRVHWSAEHPSHLLVPVVPRLPA